MAKYANLLQTELRLGSEYMSEGTFSHAVAQMTLPLKGHNRDAHPSKAMES